MKTASTGQDDYVVKSPDYFDWGRSEMLAFIPSQCRRILEVGCGNGAFGESLKLARNIEVWGVELTLEAAQKASKKLDQVMVGEFNSGMNLPEAAFDCIVFNDVLEHMLVPEEALRYARRLLRPDGVIVASIPNIRHFPAVWQLLVRGRWEYEDYGIFDRTHLRFFTKSSIVNLFTHEGYEIKSIEGINAYLGFPGSRRIRASYAIANMLSFGRLSDMKFLQFAVVAKLGGSADAEKRLAATGS